VEPELCFGRTLENSRQLKPYRGRLSANGHQEHSFMPKELTWSDAEDIGILLSETHPQLDPLAVRFTDLHKYVIALPDFKDDPAKSNEAKLEAIQMAWHAEVLDRTQG
jgi:FeS assembly protein IscX